MWVVCGTGRWVDHSAHFQGHLVSCQGQPLSLSFWLRGLMESSPPTPLLAEDERMRRLSEGLGLLIELNLTHFIGIFPSSQGRETFTFIASIQGFVRFTFTEELKRGKTKSLPHTLFLPLSPPLPLLSFWLLVNFVTLIL